MKNLLTSKTCAYMLAVITQKEGGSGLTARRKTAQEAVPEKAAFLVYAHPYPHKNDTACVLRGFVPPDSVFSGLSKLNMQAVSVLTGMRRTSARLLRKRRFAMKDHDINYFASFSSPALSMSIKKKATSTDLNRFVDFAAGITFPVQPDNSIQITESQHKKIMEIISMELQSFVNAGFSEKLLQDKSFEIKKGESHMQNNELKVFENSLFGSIRVVEIDNEPWFVAKDIAEVLGYSATEKMTRRLDDDEFVTVPFRGSPSNVTQMSLINESGLYNAIFGSQLQKAKEFKKWVTSEVLPSIRKTGSYSINDQAISWDNGAKKSSNMYFPMARLIESADKHLGGKVALRALNFFAGMPVDDLVAEIDEKNLTIDVGSMEWGREAIGNFISEMCELGDEYEIQASLAYKEFCAWCRNSGVTSTMTQKRFSLLISTRFEKYKAGTVRYRGFRIKQNTVEEI